MATIIRNFLRPPKAPNLAVGPIEYEQRYQDQLNNQLRIYFNELDNALQTIFGTDGGGGKFIRFPYGAFHEDGATTLSVAIPNGTSTGAISVASTTGFPSSGYILIDSEVIEYTSTTATTFGGTITRHVLGTSGSGHSVGAAITAVQGTGSSSTIGSVLFNNTDYSNGVSIDTTDTSKIVFDNPGIYNVQISVQLLNYTTSEDNVAFWFRLNGSDIANTASIMEVAPKHGTAPGATILTYNIFQQVAASDYLQLKWTSDTGNTLVATFPAGTSPVHPISPAVILTAQFVSSVPT
jgi:hypothetical protein